MASFSLADIAEQARLQGLDIEGHILERGLHLWEKGAVRTVIPSPDGGLEAAVIGGDRYRVSLQPVVGVHGQRRLLGECDCPYWDTCKHVGALFIDFLASGGRADRGSHAVGDALRALAVLARPEVDDPDLARLQVMMRLPVDHASGGGHIRRLELTPYTLRRGKSGKLLKPRLARHSYGFLDEDDLDPGHRYILQTLVDMKPRMQTQREVLVQPLAVSTLLGMMLDEAMLVDAESETLMARGETRQLGMAWQDSDGKHRLGWQLEQEPLGDALVLIAAGGRFWYCDRAEGLMGEADGAFSPDRVAAAGRLPVLTSKQRQELEARIVEEFAEPEVLALSPAANAPEQRLSLCGKRLEVQETTGAFAVHFVYGEGAEVAANPDCQRSYEPELGGWLLRDEPAESAAIDELVAVTDVDSGRRNGRGELLLIPGADFSWPEFSLYYKPELEQLGWDVLLPDSLSFVVHDVDELAIEMDDADAGGWWFEMGFSVECEGRQLSLVPVLASWVARHGLSDQVLAEFADEQLFPLHTDEEGGIWRLPVGLLRTLINQFADLLQDADGDTLKLPGAAMAHVGDVLDELPTAPWQPPAALAALVNRERDVAALEPLAAPAGFGAELRPYQQIGLGWLQFLADTGMHGVLADDMGLGKTVQALAHIVLQRQAQPDSAPVLVVAPTSVVGNWRREAVKFAPQLRVLVLSGPGRKPWLERLGEFDLVLTSYALLQRDREALSAQRFALVVLDEAQWIKNPRAKTAQAAKALDAERRLCLSGTPLENHTGELWSLFDFLMPGFLGSEKRFREHFRNPIEKHGDEQAMARLRARTAPFVLRRSKQLVASELPARNEMVQSVVMDSAQMAVYEAVRAPMEKKVREALAARGLGQSHIMVLEALLKLRQCCCDPRLLPGRTKGAAKAKSAKLALLMELLPTLVEDGRRVLLFSQFTSMLELIAAELDDAEIGYLKLTGRSRNRDALVERFQRGDAPVFLISLKAGGVGLNLTAADTVILYDPWWNPAVEQQAIDRAHRIGQDKSVFVYRLIAEGSIEEKMLQLQADKRQLTSGVVGEAEGVPTGLSAEQVLALMAPI